MKTALLIADLEGIGGVDDPSMLIFGSPGYPAACAHIRRRIEVSVEGRVILDDSELVVEVARQDRHQRG